MPAELELVFRPEIQSIFDHFCSLYRIRIAFCSPEGDELRVGRGWPLCPYCRLLRRRCGYEGQCRGLDAKRQSEAARLGRGMVVYRCHGGMTEAVLPLQVTGRLLGFVMIGQFRTHRRVPEKILCRTNDARLRSRVQESFARAPFYSPQQARHILGLLEVLVQFIVDRHLVSSEDALSPILRRLRQRPQERLSLRVAAAMIGRSPSTLSHLFHRRLGKSFRQVRTESLLQAAERQLRSRPGISIKEVAAGLGISDPLYFSRLYRRHRGFPPSRMSAAGSMPEAGYAKAPARR